MRTWLVLTAILVSLTPACASAKKKPLPPVKAATIAVPEVVAAEITNFDEPSPKRLEHPGASYISVYFEGVRLGPQDKLTVKSDRADGASWTYTAADVPKSGAFWSIAIPGVPAGGDESALSTVVLIELDNKSGTAAYTVPRYAAGLLPPEIDNENQRSGFLEVCGTDDTKEARCFADQQAIYNNAKPVARLLINGRNACTGWLVGGAGHLLTNHHCIGDAEDAQNVQVEFMAEGDSCQKNCKSWFACRGKVVATSGQLLKASSTKDYALLQLDPKVTRPYGYLKLRRAGPKLGERVYIPQHPRGSGKRVAVNSSEPRDKTGPTPGFTHINSLTEWACGGISKNETGYLADTDPGASGSPVIAFSDNTVVALHHCGGCPNRGIPIDKIIPEIQSFLPANAFK